MRRNPLENADTHEVQALTRNQTLILQIMWQTVQMSHKNEEKVQREVLRL